MITKLAACGRFEKMIALQDEQQMIINDWTIASIAFKLAELLKTRAFYSDTTSFSLFLNLFLNRYEILKLLK